MVIFATAWNFYFPTNVEKLLWRISSIYFIVYGAIGDIYIWFWDQSTLKKGKDRITPLPLQEQAHQRKKMLIWDQINHFADKLRNLSPDKDPELAIPLRIWSFPTLLCALYCFGRTYILVEDLIGLRRLPADAYTTVEWSQYIPHLWCLLLQREFISHSPFDHQSEQERRRKVIKVNGGRMDATHSF